MTGIVPVYAILCVELGILADVLHVRRGFGSCRGSQDLLVPASRRE
jgi:hypothetical protein